MGFPELRLDGAALNWDPAEVTVPPVPGIPPGADPMSVMIAAIMPIVAVPVAEGVAETRAREERFAENVAGARSAYRNTDDAAGQQIQSAGGEATAATGAGSAPDAGSPPVQAGQLGGQLMGMSMQIASQAAQIPQQVMGMAASIPQGIAQGVQTELQQVGQMSGAGNESSKGAEYQGESSADDLAASGLSADNSGERALLGDPLESSTLAPAQTSPAETSPERTL